MFIHNFKYSLKLLLKNRQLVFWTLAFPIIMAVLFNMAFSNIENSETLEAIDIAVVDDNSFNSSLIYKNSLKSLGEGDERLFNITYTDEKGADELLYEKKVTGIFRIVKNEPVVTVNSNGLRETVLCYVVNEIKSTGDLVMKLGFEDIRKNISSGNKIDYEKEFTNIAQDVLSSDANINNVSTSNMSYIMIEYYSLIAMACMYSGLLSMTLMNYRLANVSAVGKRSAVSSAKKSRIVLPSLLASFVVQIAGLILLYLVLIFYVRADFGNELPKIILLSLAGSIAGLSVGTAVSVLVKAGENAKFTGLVGVIMAGCFFAGMMGVMMKNIVDKNVPILNKINPVAMITDGLYALYYYNSYERFWFDVISLAVFSLIVLLISINGLRRQTYDSI